MTKILENKSMMIHIGVEIVAIMGIMFVNNKRNRELKSRIEQLEQAIITQSEVIKSMQEYLKNTIDNNQMSSMSSSVSSALSSFKDEYDEKLLSVIERVEELSVSKNIESAPDKEELPRAKPSVKRDSLKNPSPQKPNFKGISLTKTPVRREPPSNFKSVRLEEPEQIKIKIFPVVSPSFMHTRSNVEIIDEENDASQEEKEQLERELADELAELQEE